MVLAVRGGLYVVVFQIALLLALVLLGLFFAAPAFFGFETFMLSVFLIVWAVAGFGVHATVVSGFFGIGILILPFSFLSSLFLSVGVFEYWRLVIILENNPDIWIEAIRDAVFFGVLPLATALVFGAFGWKRQGIPRSRFAGAFLISMASFFVIWGVFYFQRIMGRYSLALNETAVLDLGYLNGSLLAIYATYGLIGVLWVFVGFFFLASSIHTLRSYGSKESG